MIAPFPRGNNGIDAWLQRLHPTDSAELIDDSLQQKLTNLPRAALPAARSRGPYFLEIGRIGTDKRAG